MSWLAEDSLPIWMGGAVLLTFAIVVYLHSRSTRALVAMGVIVVLTGALVVVERVLVTPREAVLETLYEVAAAVEANDMPVTLTFLSPEATSEREEVQSLMPRLDIKKARVVGTPEIVVDQAASPMTASVTFRGFIDVTEKRTGMKGGYFDDIQMELVHTGDRWLIARYTPEKNWGRGAGRQPRPARLPTTP